MNQQNLLPFDTPLNNNNIQYFNNQYNDNGNILSITQKFATMIITQIICLSVLIIGFFILIMAKVNSTAIFIYGMVILSVLFWYVFGMSQIISEVQFIKSAYLNQLTVKIKKLCCGFKQYTLMLENAYVFCEKINERTIKIVMINTLKNPREIDLDKSNIKNSPLNLIYEINNIRGNYDEIKIKIDNFLGPQNYENNIYDEINKYNSLYNKNYESDEKKLIHKYMKISEHFYTFFLFKKKRIDFIYSDDFERLFIGEVNDSKYNNTLLFNIREIDSFEMVEKDGDEDTEYFLQINDKNYKQSQISMGLNYQNKNYLPKFILLLNGKLNDINEKILNNYNYTPLNYI